MFIYVGAQATTFPYDAVVHLEVTFESGQKFFGSGAMVGPNDVLTAAHMVWSAVDGKATEVKVFAGYNNGAEPYGEVDAVADSYFQWDVNGDDLATISETTDDLAVLALPSRLGDKTGWFQLSANGGSGYYNLTGYPGSFSGPNGPQMMTQTGFVQKDPNYSAFTFQGIISLSGNSGGPLWYQGPNGPTIVGVDSTSVHAADIAKHFDWLAGAIADNDKYITAAPPPVVPLAPQLDVTVAASKLFYQFVWGAAPDTAEYNKLLNFSELQYISYQNMGTARPELGPFEALGVAFSSEPQFTAKFGAGDDTSFVNKSYALIFERAPNAAQTTHFVQQAAFYENMYASAGLPSAVAIQRAHGAVAGQMLAIATLDEEASHPYIVGIVGLPTAMEALA